MSTASCAFPNQTRAIPTLTSTLDSGNNTEPVSNSSADDCFEPCYLESVEDTFCNFRHDYDPSSNSNRINTGPGSSSIGTSSNSDRSISNNGPIIPSPTVRSKTSAHSDGISSSNIPNCLNIIQIRRSAVWQTTSSGA